MRHRLVSRLVLVSVIVAVVMAFAASDSSAAGFSFLDSLRGLLGKGPLFGRASAPFATGATFAEAGTTLNFDLAAGASVTIVANAGSYTLTLGGADTWAGTDSANVTGNGTGTLTVTAAGTAFFTDINFTDSGNGATLIFGNSGGNAFSQNITVTLDNTGAAIGLNGDVTTLGAMSFTGATTLGADVIVANTTNSNITFNSTVDGAHTLTVNTIGTTRLNGQFRQFDPTNRPDD